MLRGAGHRERDTHETPGRRFVVGLNKTQKGQEDHRERSCLLIGGAPGKVPTAPNAEVSIGPMARAPPAQIGY